MWSGWPPGEGRRGILEEAWVPASTGAAADAGAAAEAGSEAQGSGSEAHGQRPRSAQLDARSPGRRRRAQALYVRRTPSRSHTSAHYKCRPVERTHASARGIAACRGMVWVTSEAPGVKIRGCTLFLSDGRFSIPFVSMHGVQGMGGSCALPQSHTSAHYTAPESTVPRSR